MVRLEDIRQFEKEEISKSFNSYMVRLEAPLPDHSARVAQVSIPLWCDWKKIDRINLAKVKIVSIPIWCDWKHLLEINTSLIWKFQFLYGEIGSIDRAWG